MQKKTAKRIRKWLIIVFIIYIAGGIGLYFFQEQMIFHPQRLPNDHVFKFEIPFKEINLPVNNEKNLNIIQFTVPDSISKGVVLYFHGNTRNIERYAPFAANFTKYNYEVWMMDYPGFGKSTGERSEQAMYDDSELFYKMAMARFPADSIIIYGKSIGTGVASRLASRVDCKRLLLETPYYSLDALLNHYAFIYPVSWLTKYHFPTYEFFENIDAPVSIFHGTDDQVIPYSQAERLHKLKPGTELIRIEKGKHNDLDESKLYQQKLDSLLNH